MSELSKYQRSKQCVMEMMEQLKKKYWMANNKGNDPSLRILKKSIKELDNTVKQLDDRIAKLQPDNKDKAA